MFKKLFRTVFWFFLIGLAIKLIKKCPFCKEHFELCKKHVQDLLQPDVEEEEETEEAESKEEE